MAVAGSARNLCLMRALLRRLERSLAEARKETSRWGLEHRGWRVPGTRSRPGRDKFRAPLQVRDERALVQELAEGPGHRPIPFCRAQNCEKPREVATRGRSGARRCDGRIFPDDGRCGGRGLRGSCEQRSPSLRVVRGPRGAGLGCKAEVRRRGGRLSSSGKTARRSARRFRRGRRIRSARAGDQRHARWRRGNRG
jgi:hypothetical protein